MKIKTLSMFACSLVLLAGVTWAQDNATSSSSKSDDTSSTKSTDKSATDSNATSPDKAKVEQVHGSQSQSEAEGRLDKAATVLDQLTDIKESAVPDKVLKNAKCVAIVPSMVKGGFVIGAQHGRGVATCRLSSGAWSAPAFFTITGGTWGAQIGAAAIDLVMLIMNQKGMDNLLSSNFSLGASGTVAAGPIGRSASADTDIKMNAEVLTYSRARGAFAGVTLNGASIRPDRDSTIAYYGSDKTFKQLLGGSVPAPASAKKFLTQVRTDFREANSEQNAEAH